MIIFSRFWQQIKSVAFFLGRQLYRLFIIWPFLAIVNVVFWRKHSTAKSDPPADYCFIITSLIYPKTGRIQYGSPRTMFTPEQRTEQTLETVASIRRKVPGAKIVLVEAGLKEELPLELVNKVDQFIYVGDRVVVRFACDSIFKSLGEVVMLLCAVPKFIFKSDFYFKISGRYHLNDKFDIENWKRGVYVLLYIKEDYVCTRLYGFRSEAFREWHQILWKSLPFVLIGYAVENTLAKFIPRQKVFVLKRLGVQGLGGSQNIVVED